MLIIALPCGRLGFCGLLAFLTATTIAGAQADSTAANRVLRIAVPRPTQAATWMSPQQLRTVAPLVASMASVPATVTIRVGDTVSVDSVARIVALDANKNVIGNVPPLEGHLRHGTAALVSPRRFTGLEEGPSEFTIYYPNTYWNQPTPRPFAVVRVEVRSRDGSITMTRDPTCATDWDSTRAMVARVYPGYPEAHLDSPALVALTQRVGQDVANAPNATSCTAAIGRWLDGFAYRGLDIGTSAPPGPRPPPPPGVIAPTRPLSLRYPEDSTALLIIPDFDAASKPAIDSLIANSPRLRKTPRLIIDLQFASGGWTQSYESLLPLIYSGPITELGAEARAADGFAAASPPRTIRFDSVLANPHAIAVIVTRVCAGACEQFVFDAKQSAKVKILGPTPTAGLLEFGTVRKVDLPSGLRRLSLPTTRLSRTPERPLLFQGIRPDVVLPPSELATDNGVGFAIGILHGQPAPARPPL